MQLRSGGLGDILVSWAEMRKLKYISNVLKGNGKFSFRNDFTVITVSCKYLEIENKNFCKMRYRF